MLGATLSLPLPRPNAREGRVGMLPWSSPSQCQVLCSRDSPFQATGPRVRPWGFIWQEQGGRARGKGSAHLWSKDSGYQEFLSKQRDNTSCAGSRGTESQTWPTMAQGGGNTGPGLCCCLSSTRGSPALAWMRPRHTQGLDAIDSGFTQQVLRPSSKSCSLIPIL